MVPGRQACSSFRSKPVRLPHPDANVCFGKVRIAGTRHYIDGLLAMIEGGASFDDILADHPHLTLEQLKAMMGFVRDVVASKRNRLKGEHKNG